MTDLIDMSWSELVELGKEQQQRIEQLEAWCEQTNPDAYEKWKALQEYRE